MPTEVSSGPAVSVPTSARMSAALQAMRDGIPVILTDHADREDEADLILAAEKVTVPTMALVIRECSGIVCLCLHDEDANRLGLPPMVPENESRYGTAFTVSIDARNGITTGVSAKDRVTTILAAIAPGAKPEDLVRPGHIFPLRTAKGGVLERPGHTEGSVALAEMAGLRPAAILCELMNPDGTMTRGKQLIEFAKQHNFPLLSIEEVIDHAKELSKN